MGLFFKVPAGRRIPIHRESVLPPLLSKTVLRGGLFLWVYFFKVPAGMHCSMYLVGTRFIASVVTLVLCKGGLQILVRLVQRILALPLSTGGL